MCRVMLYSIQYDTLQLAAIAVTAKQEHFSSCDHELCGPMTLIFKHDLD